MRSCFRTVNEKRTSCRILARAIAAIDDWSLTRRAGCCDVASLSGRPGKPRLYITLIYAIGIYLCARFLFDRFLYLRPGIFQRHSAVKHGTNGFGIPVDAKIPEAFELRTAFNWRVPTRCVELIRRDPFERVRI